MSQTHNAMRTAVGNAKQWSDVQASSANFLGEHHDCINSLQSILVASDPFPRLSPQLNHTSVQLLHHHEHYPASGLTHNTMFPLRAVSRSFPRIASRSTNYSTRSAFRTSIKSSLRTATASRQPLVSRLAAFSTSAVRSDTASQELSAKLANEISLEAENAERKTDSDSNVETFLANNSWEVIDNSGEQDVVLKRTYDDETIMVTFSIADFNTPGVYDTESDEAFHDEETDDPGEMTAQSGGGNTKGAVNQGRTPQGNFKVAPEDSIAPADREELANEEVGHTTHAGNQETTR